MTRLILTDSSHKNRIRVNNTFFLFSLKKLIAKLLRNHFNFAPNFLYNIKKTLTSFSYFYVIILIKKRSDFYYC